MNATSSSSAKHIPGPWVPRTARTMIHIKGPKGELICSMSKGGFIGLPPNVPLICMAPAMLAALKELISIEGQQPGNAEWARKVNALIAQADNDRYAGYEWVDSSLTALEHLERNARRICHCTNGFHEPQPGCGDCGGTGFRPVEE